ncbi:hypothetical protein DLE36_17690, partial [Salmonella enterica]|nr:hypothetical protein [Salmonella enterica]
ERIFSIDNRFSGTKDFTLRQGGKRSDGRSILKYVTDVRKSSQRRIRVKDSFSEHKEFAWRH